MDAPADYRSAGTFMLVSGILNILISIGLIAGLVWILVGCFWVVTLVGGILEIVVGIAVMNGKPKPGAKTTAILGIINSVLCGNIIGIIMEVLALTKLGTQESEEFMTLHG